MRCPREDAVILLLPRTYTGGGWTGKVEGEEEPEKDRGVEKQGERKRERERERGSERERESESEHPMRKTESSAIFQRSGRTNDGCNSRRTPYSSLI